MVIAGSLLLAFGALTTITMSVDVGEGSQTGGTVVHIVVFREQTNVESREGNRQIFEQKSIAPNSGQTEGFLRQGPVFIRGGIWMYLACPANSL